MNDGEDICGCIACLALCGVCSVAAAEEDKREREHAAAGCGSYYTHKSPPRTIYLQPVPVASPRTQKAYYENYANTQREEKKKAKQGGKGPPPPAYY